MLITYEDLKKMNLIDFRIIGKRIKEVREFKKTHESKDFTQAKMSEALGLNSSTYFSKLESGNAKINMTRLYQICYLLDYKVEDIISGTGRYSQGYLAPELNSILRDKSPEQIDYIVGHADNYFKHNPSFK